MQNWYISHGGQQIGPVAETEIATRVGQGEFPVESLVWNESLDEWKPLSDFPQFAAPAQTVATTASTVPAPSEPVKEEVQSLYAAPKAATVPRKRGMMDFGYCYRDAGRLGNGVIGLFVALTCIEIPMAVLGIFISDPNDPEAVNFADIGVGILGMLYLLIYIIGIIFYCIWKVRCAKNTQVLTGKRLEISPGWSVGYYFIPFINLWRPFQAMKGIWEATFGEKEGPLGGWWTCYILSNILGNVSFRSSMNGLHEVSLGADLLGALIAIPLLLTIVKIIRSLNKEHAAMAKNADSLDAQSI